MLKVSALIASLCALALPIRGFSADEARSFPARAGSGGRGASYSPARPPGEPGTGGIQTQAELRDSPLGGDLAAPDTVVSSWLKARRIRFEALRALKATAAGEPINLDASAPQMASSLQFRLERDFAGPSFVSSYPEADIAAGPDHLVQAARRVVRVTDKRGSTLMEEPFSTWWSSVVTDYVANGASVVYDTNTARWVLGVTGWSTTTFDSWYLLSVTKTADPTGDWCAFALPAWIDGNTPTNTFTDFFLRIDVDARGAYLASNQFDNDTGEFVYSKLRVIDKAALYDPSCGPLSWHDFTGLTTTGEDSVMPARTLEDPDREYLIGTPSLGGSEIRLWSVAWSGGAPVLTAEATLPVPPFAVPPDVSQPHEEAPLHMIDARLLSAVYQAGTVYAANTVACAGGNACVRFLGVDVSTRSVVYDETYGAPGVGYMAAGLGVNGAGDLVAVMNRSGAQEFVGSRFAVRPRAAGSFASSTALRSGEDVRYVDDGLGRNLWSLQNGASADPSDPRRVWIIAAHAGRTPGEYGTWVGAVVPAGSHTLTINSGPSVNTNPVFPGFPVDLSATAVDTSGHSLVWAWSSSCTGIVSGGAFDDPASPSPVWTPPVNPGLSARTCNLSVTVEDGGSASATGSTHLVLLPDPDQTRLNADFSTSTSWTAYPPWSLSGESVHSAPYAFSDSPTTPYAPNVNTILYSPYFEDASDFAYLSWWHTYDIARDGDLASLWTKKDLGKLTRVRSFAGTRVWHQAFLDLSPYIDAFDLLLGFQVYSNSAGSGDGWHLDDVVVRGLSFVPHAIAFTGGPRSNANPVLAGKEVDLSAQARDLFDIQSGHRAFFTWSSDCPQLGSGGNFSDTTIPTPVWTSPPNTTGSPAECSISVAVSDHAGLSTAASFSQTVLPDADADGVEDGLDVCLSVYDPGQIDGDGDGTGDACDVCPSTVDPAQADLDADGRGDACDNCPATANAAQDNSDGDDVGDACDVCPSTVDPAQADLDADGRGDACDNCSADSNPGQSDLDADGAGDACDLTVVSPLDGAALACDADPPAIVWTAGRFDQFRVDVSTEPAFRPNRRITNGKKLLGSTVTTWTAPAKKWSRTCRRAGSGSLYVRVYGRVRGAKDSGYSQVVVLDVP